MPQFLAVFHDQYGSAFVLSSRSDILFVLLFFVVNIDVVRIGRIYLLFFCILFASSQFFWRVCLLVLREVNRESRAFTDLTLQGNPSVVQFYKPLYQRQADAASFASVFYLIEPFKNLFLLLFRNADAGVGHLQYQFIPFFIELHRDALTNLRVLESVGQQIIDNQIQIVCIEQHLLVLQLGIKVIVYILLFRQALIIEEAAHYPLIRIGVWRSEFEDA